MTLRDSLVGALADDLICDSHMHVFQLPGARDLRQTRITPDVPKGVLSEYLPIATRLGIHRFIVVQPSHFGSDNFTTLAAVRALGAEARAVVIPPSNATEADIELLAAQGGVAARIFLLRDTGLGISHLKRMAELIAPFGWHLEVQCEGEQLASIVPVLSTLPVSSVIDHLGRMPKGTPADGALFGALIEHARSERGWVKLSAPYHNSKGHYSGFDDLRPQIEALARVAPDRLVWASNWPHVQFSQKPDDLSLANEMLRLLPDPALTRRVLIDNPRSLYRFK